MIGKKKIGIVLAMCVAVTTIGSTTAFAAGMNQMHSGKVLNVLTAQVNGFLPAGLQKIFGNVKGADGVTIDKDGKVITANGQKGEGQIVMSGSLSGLPVLSPNAIEGAIDKNGNFVDKDGKIIVPAEMVLKGEYGVGEVTLIGGPNTK